MLGQRLPSGYFGLATLAKQSTPQPSESYPNHDQTKQPMLTSQKNQAVTVSPSPYAIAKVSSALSTGRLV